MDKVWNISHDIGQELFNLAKYEFGTKTIGEGSGVVFGTHHTFVESCVLILRKVTNWSYNIEVNDFLEKNKGRIGDSCLVIGETGSKEIFNEFKDLYYKLGGTYGLRPQYYRSFEDKEYIIVDRDGMTLGVFDKVRYELTVNCEFYTCRYDFYYILEFLHKTGSLRKKHRYVDYNYEVKLVETNFDFDELIKTYK